MTTYQRPPIRQGLNAVGTHYEAESTLTPTSCPSETVGVLPPLEAIPVIFVPGIMGSNLKTRANQPILDSKGRVVVPGDTPVWRVDSNGGVAQDWLFASAQTRQLKLRHAVVEVDDGGLLNEGHNPKEQNALTGQTAVARLDLKVAREQRRWGTVSAAFYGEFLDNLEHLLNDIALNGDQTPNPALSEWINGWAQVPQAISAEHNLQSLSEAELKNLLMVRNPVYAFGYNWLQSNATSGDELVKFIDEVIAQNNQGCMTCNKVMLLTHSMGGLVARHAVTVGGAKDKVAGVFHNVMPTDGAAAAYQRMLTGVEAGYFERNVMGNDGQKVTATLIMSPAGLQLLPNARYNSEGGQIKPWLHIQDSDSTVRALPQSDPYTEIYLNTEQWWRLANQGWMDPAHLYEEAEELQIAYEMNVNDAKSFHSKVQGSGDFHPNTHAIYGSGIDTYENVTWQLSEAPWPGDEPWQQVKRDIDLDSATDDRLERQYPSHSNSPVSLMDPASPIRAEAALQKAEARGDGTVPTAASAAHVDAGIKAGNVRAVLGSSDFEHGGAYKHQANSLHITATLHAVCKIVNEELA